MLERRRNGQNRDAATDLSKNEPKIRVPTADRRRLQGRDQRTANITRINDLGAVVAVHSQQRTDLAQADYGESDKERHAQSITDPGCASGANAVDSLRRRGDQKNCPQQDHNNDD